MITPLVPTKTLMLDRERTLRMDLNALSDFERIAGKSIMNGELDLARLSVADIRTLVWAGLVQDDESLTEREVGRFLHVGNLPEIANAIADLVSASLPEQEAGAATVPLQEESESPSTG